MHSASGAISYVTVEMATISLFVHLMPVWVGVNISAPFCSFEIQSKPNFHAFCQNGAPGVEQLFRLFGKIFSNLYLKITQEKTKFVEMYSLIKSET